MENKRTPKFKGGDTIMTRFKERETNRPMRPWRITYADGKVAVVTAKSSMEAVRAGRALYKMMVQKVEDSFE